MTSLDAAGAGWRFRARRGSSRCPRRTSPATGSRCPGPGSTPTRACWQGSSRAPRRRAAVRSSTTGGCVRASGTARAAARAMNPPAAAIACTFASTRRAPCAAVPLSLPSERLRRDVGRVVLLVDRLRDRPAAQQARERRGDARPVPARGGARAHRGGAIGRLRRSGEQAGARRRPRASRPRTSAASRLARTARMLRATALAAAGPIAADTARAGVAAAGGAGSFVDATSSVRSRAQAARRAAAGGLSLAALGRRPLDSVRSPDPRPARARRRRRRRRPRRSSATDALAGWVVGHLEALDQLVAAVLVDRRLLGDQHPSSLSNSAPCRRSRGRPRASRRRRSDLGLRVEVGPRTDAQLVELEAARVGHGAFIPDSAAGCAHGSSSCSVRLTSASTSSGSQPLARAPFVARHSRAGAPPRRAPRRARRRLGGASSRATSASMSSAGSPLRTSRSLRALEHLADLLLLLGAPAGELGVGALGPRPRRRCPARARPGRSGRTCCSRG